MLRLAVARYAVLNLTTSPTLNRISMKERQCFTDVVILSVILQTVHEHEQARMGNSNTSILFLLFQVFLQNLHVLVHCCNCNCATVGPSWCDDGVVASLHHSRHSSKITRVEEKNAWSSPNECKTFNEYYNGGDGQLCIPQFSNMYFAVSFREISP